MSFSKIESVNLKMIASEGARRSIRLAKKAPPRTVRRSIRINFSSVMDLDSDNDEDVIYVPPSPPPMVDLTEPEFKEPPCSRPVVVLKDVLEKSPRKKEPPTNLQQARQHTPPKQRKLDNDENAPSVTTPSTQLGKLSLESPSRKSDGLFPEKDPYQSARRALHSMFPKEMPGRERELGELREFILKHLQRGTSGTLYVSGPPGTGKTASLNVILQEKEISSQIEKVYVNCTSIKSSRAIFSRIAKDLGLQTGGKNEKECVLAVEHFFKNNQKPVLLVLDEIDQLESKHQSVLYTIFEWPSIPGSHLVLVGIANALDLTDRTLPRLQARCELKPILMHFAPYTKDQIVAILFDRLQGADVVDTFSTAALHLLAGKVAAVSGDVRRALDIGRRVVELAERRRRQLKSVENISAEEEEKEKKSVDVHQVVGVLNAVYGTASVEGGDVEEALPLQQKIVVCTVVLMLKKASNRDVTVGRLHEVYRRVCAKRNIQAVDQGEFVGLCSLIEARGILRVTRRKEWRMSKVRLVWDEEEVAGALRDKQLMADILQDEDSLEKV